MLAVTASSTWAVQMLEVAFSRRMCCSRVCSASRKRRRAVDVLGDPDQPPGQRPLQSGPDRDEPGVRAAVEQRHAEPLAGADSDVGAPLPRRRGQRSGPAGRRRRSPGRPAAWAASAIARSSSVPASRPLAPGVWTTTANGVDLASAVQQRPIGHHDLEPRAAARVRTTPIGLRQGVGVEQQHRAGLRWSGGPGSSPRRPRSPRRAGWRRRWADR